jgi:DNA helicase-2/ATP-dependent DNA helicase PcrA
MNDGDFSYNDFAVFYRTNAQSRVIEEQLRTMSIPYRIVGGVKFYERMEIKDVISYMKLAINPGDNIAFRRVINTPTRGIGKTTVDRLDEMATAEKISMMQMATKVINTREFNAGTTGKLRRFLDLMEALTREAASKSLYEFYSILLDLTEYVMKLKAEDTVESKARIENLEELDNAIMQFEKERGEEGTLQAFLEEMALVSDVDSMDSEHNSVTLMTLHISKGLEFPVVFVVGMEEGLFPSGRSVDDADASSVEEERRLAYVGMTRAREELFLTYARSRRVWGQEQYNPPSRFLKEIPNQFVKFTSSVESPKFMSRFQQSGFSGGPGSAPTSYAKPKKQYQDFDTHSFPNYDDDSTSASGGFAEGSRVRHPTFGAGSVFKVEGSGEDQKVSVLFSDNTIKKFVVKYARLEKI